LTPTKTGQATFRGVASQCARAKWEQLTPKIFKHPSFLGWFAKATKMATGVKPFIIYTSTNETIIINYTDAAKDAKGGELGGIFVNKEHVITWAYKVPPTVSQKFSINVLEAIAILFQIEIMRRHAHDNNYKVDTTGLFYIDNLAAAFCFVSGCSRTSAPLSRVIATTWEQFDTMCIEPSFRWISTHRNPADATTRVNMKNVCTAFGATIFPIDKELQTFIDKAFSIAGQQEEQKTFFLQK
jgi:hypothetical protein